MKIASAELPQELILIPGEYIEIQLTRVSVGRPHSVIYKTILDPSFGCKETTVRAVDLIGERK